MYASKEAATKSSQPSRTVAAAQPEPAVSASLPTTSTAATPRQAGQQQRIEQLRSSHRDQAAAPIQRVIKIGDSEQTASKKRLKKWKNRANLSANERAKVNSMRDSAQDYHYPSLAKLKQGIKRARARENWYANGSPGADPAKTERRNLSPYDPLYQETASKVMSSHEAEPYPTDALHEQGPLMGPWLDSSMSRVNRSLHLAKGLVTPSTWIGNNAADRPSMYITQIEALRNPKLMARYATAKTDIEGRNGGLANEHPLYSGHRPAGMDFITRNGHDPSYGAYDSGWFGKGHGAHGRGAYFTEQVDKAVSYSSEGQVSGEHRSFLMQDVLLGNSMAYQERGKFRHRHHNEMVRDNRPHNKAIPDGTPEAMGENMSQYDSLVGQKTAEPGNGLWGTLRDRKKFDSDEYMVRNADQILPRYRIRYTK